MTDVQAQSLYNIAKERDVANFLETLQPSADISFRSDAGRLCAKCRHISNGRWIQVEVDGLLPGYVLSTRWGTYYSLLDEGYDHSSDSSVDRSDTSSHPRLFWTPDGITPCGDASSRLFVHHDRDSLELTAHNGCHMCTYILESRNCVFKTLTTCGSIHERWDSSFPEGYYTALPLLHCTGIKGQGTPTLLLDFILVENRRPETISRANCQLWLCFGFDRVYVSEPGVNSHGTAEGHVNDPTRPLVVEKAGPTVQLSAQLKERLDQWRQGCTHHGVCREYRKRARPKGSTELPTRLIELIPDADEPDGSCMIRLRDSSELQSEVEYATLSHCWGPAGISFKLVQANILEFRAGVKKDRLSQVFSDAIDVAMSLGLRYMWIDALCIVQDLTTDWAIEFKRMGSVFSRASINIAATASHNGEEGMFRQRNSLLASPLVLESMWRGADFKPGRWAMTRSKTWYYQIDSGPLNQRGWVLQELILAPETLHFTADQIWWSCQTVRKGEATLDQAPSFSIPNALYQWNGRRWTAVIEIFSQLQLSRADDRLAAVAGIASSWATKLGWSQRDYLAGLWRPELCGHLLWATLQPCVRTSLAPSWSWASVDGAVKWYNSYSPFVAPPDWCTVTPGPTYGDDDDENDRDGYEEGDVSKRDEEKSKETAIDPLARRIRATMHAFCRLFRVVINPRQGEDLTQSEIHLQNSIPINIAHANTTQSQGTRLINGTKKFTSTLKHSSLQPLTSTADTPSAVIFLADTHRTQQQWRQTEAYFLPMRYGLNSPKTRPDLGSVMSMFGLMLEPINGRLGTYRRIGFVRMMYARDNYTEGGVVDRWKEVERIPKSRYRRQMTEGLYMIDIV